jgi:hypothetical protein
MFRTPRKIFGYRFPLYWLVIWAIYRGIFWERGILGEHTAPVGKIYAGPQRGESEQEEASRIPAEAFWGEPFGVARVSLPLGSLTHPLGAESWVVNSPQNRVFYPALEEGSLRALLRKKTGLPLGRCTLYFLFTGKDPLEVQIRTPGDTRSVRLVPGEHRRGWSRLLADWKEAFSPRSREHGSPLFLEQYLEAMLSRRLGLEQHGPLEAGRLRNRPDREKTPEEKTGPKDSPHQSWFGPEWEALLRLESLRRQMFLERIEGRSHHWHQPADRPLSDISLPNPPDRTAISAGEIGSPGLPRNTFSDPKAHQTESPRAAESALEPVAAGKTKEKGDASTFSSPGGPEQKAPLEIEPLASRVPEECFYIRFGGMAEFAWFRELLDWAAGQWTMCVAGRGVDYQRVRRSEERLCLRPTGWSQLLGRHLGGQVENLAVADVALIGLDLFQPEGSGLGVLFQARSEPMLRAEIERQRSEAVRSGQGKVREEKLPIEGRLVSVLQSEDGRIHSFYVADGPWHLVSTSRRLVERFLQTHSGRGCLAEAPDFRAIRAKYPPRPEQTAFWYFSEAFWRMQCSPAYLVEMRRRMQAEVDILLVQMARQAALTEGRPAESIDNLVAQGFLPPEFGPRTDGSRAVLQNGQVWDSLRGRPGYFRPIADMQVSRLSAAEAQQVEKYLRAVSAAGSRLSPMTIVFRRSEPQKGLERIDMEIFTSPLPTPLWEMLGRLLGTASSERIVPPPGDVAFAQGRVSQGRVFVGLRATQPAEVRLGRGRLLLDLLPPGPQMLLEAMRIGYVGRQGHTPLLETVEKLVTGRPDQEGYTGKPGGLWRRQIGPFVLYSFDRQILAEVGPLLRLENTNQPAQLHLQIQDPDDTPLGQGLRQWAFRQAQEACLANLRLLTTLENQFHLSGQAALTTAQQWLQGQLICPLGGRYEYRQMGRGGWHWTATALTPVPSQNHTVVPPPMDWFRGLEAWARWESQEVQIFISILRQKKPLSGSH